MCTDGVEFGIFCVIIGSGDTADKSAVGQMDNHAQRTQCGINRVGVEVFLFDSSEQLFHVCKRCAFRLFFGDGANPLMATKMMSSVISDIKSGLKSICCGRMLIRP